MRCHGLFLHTAVLIVMTAAAAAQQPPPADKQPWQWTVEERIAERCDRSAARARLEQARVEGRAPTRKRDGHVTWSPVTDIIYGQSTPHLFLPTELFEIVVRNGFILDGWREIVADRMVESGLPPTFWSDLQPVAVPFIADLRQDLSVAEMTDKAAAARLYQEMAPQICASRAEALVKARAMFGTALDVFMYRHVAPGTAFYIDRVENPAALRAREQGCR